MPRFLVVPDLEAGNMLAKNLTFLAKADAAGIVLGARVPIILTSRAKFSAAREWRLARLLCSLRPHAGARRRCRRHDDHGHDFLVVNAGSSSLKFQVFETDGKSSLKRLVKGQMDGIGTRPRLRAQGADNTPLIDQIYGLDIVPDVPGAIRETGAWLRTSQKFNLVAVGHRVVHGGPGYSQPLLIDSSIVAKLERYIPLAPLHQPNNLAPIRSILKSHPELPQVACFDTAFHRGHSAVADHFAIPESLYKEGVRRYGFHGLSYEFVARRLGQLSPEIREIPGDYRPFGQRGFDVRIETRPQH